MLKKPLEFYYRWELFKFGKKLTTSIAVQDNYWVGWERFLALCKKLVSVLGNEQVISTKSAVIV